MSPNDRKYTREHEWAKIEGESIVVGITDHAQHELGDVVYVELPKVGAQITQGKPFGVVESVKAASDLFAPVGGEVVAVNSELDQTPQLVNEDPLGRGWMIKVRPEKSAQFDELLDGAAYDQLIGA